MYHTIYKQEFTDKNTGNVYNGFAINSDYEILYSYDDGYYDYDIGHTRTNVILSDTPVVIVDNLNSTIIDMDEKRDYHSLYKDKPDIDGLESEDDFWCCLHCTDMLVEELISDLLKNSDIWFSKFEKYSNVKQSR